MPRPQPEAPEESNGNALKRKICQPVKVQKPPLDHATEFGDMGGEFSS